MFVQVSMGIAFLAGLASFLSPCVFSLVPAYIGYLSGRSLAGGQEHTNRWSTFGHGLAFVLGFSLVFIAVGVAVGSIGSLMKAITPILAKVGGVVIVIFGLHMTGLIRLPFLEYDLRPQSRMDQRRSFFSSLMMGVFFSAGWAPCTGPTLGAIMTMAWNGGSVLDGVRLLGAYSAGLAVPFLIAALGIGWVTLILRRYGKVMHYAEIFMGVVMIAMGIMLFFGFFESMLNFGVYVNFGL